MDSKSKKGIENFEALRLQAIELVNSRDDKHLNYEIEKTNDLIEELRVYQAELEIQNDQLRATQEELEESRLYHSELFHYSPTGYAVLSDKGFILDANETLAHMLGLERSDILNRAFNQYVSDEDESVFLGRFKMIMKKEHLVYDDISLQHVEKKTSLFKLLQKRFSG
jgi:PAS domain-containing protein